MVDVIYLNSLRVQAVIGVLEWERAIEQELRIDLEIGCDLAKAAASEDLSDSLDYAEIADIVSTFVKVGQFKLVESVADGIASLLQDEYGVKWVRVKVGKPAAVKQCAEVGVVIERGERL